MTPDKLELYAKTKERFRELGIENPADVIVCLAEENERLKSVEFTCGFVKPHKVLDCPIFDEIERTKADTVRKMQERLKVRFKGGKCNLYTVYNIQRYIDQIAKEMMEGL